MTAIAFEDINGETYVLSHMYGVYTLRDEDGGLVDYGMDLERLVGQSLGYHALQNCIASLEGEEDGR